MNQASCQTFLPTAILPSERTAVIGVVNVVQTLSQSARLVVAGGLVVMRKVLDCFSGTRGREGDACSEKIEDFSTVPGCFA